MENNEMKNNKKKVLILSCVIAVSLIVSIISVTYAYFTASINNSNNEQTVIKSGYMELEFTDGEVLGTKENMVPGESVQKKFRVKNTGTVRTLYDVYLSEVINTFATKSDLVYSLTTDDEAFNKTNIEAPAAPDKIVEQRIIEVGATQEYTLTLTFKETNVNQDNNKGKRFAGKIAINEYHDATITINYNGNGIDVTPSSQDITVNTALSALPTPERGGYSLDGWYTEAEGGEQVTTSTIFNDNTTIYAHWSEANTVSYRYWHDNYEENWYGEGNLPETTYANYTDFVTPNQTSLFIKSKVINGEGSEAAVCVYYGPTNKVFCLEDNYCSTDTACLNDNYEEAANHLKDVVSAELETDDVTTDADSLGFAVRIGDVYISGTSHTISTDTQYCSAGNYSYCTLS